MASSDDYSFWGEHEQRVDEKWRVIMPQEFRAPLGEEFIIARGPDRATWVFPKTSWEDIEGSLRGGPALQRERAFLRQLLVGSRTLVKLDMQGRLALPKHLRDWSEI